jgi:hypothetical protein
MDDDDDGDGWMDGWMRVRAWFGPNRTERAGLVVASAPVWSSTRRNRNYAPS